VMCIFNRPVATVSGTNILVLRTNNGRQITIYENAVSAVPGAQGSNAMILPAPFKDTPGNDVEFLNLKNSASLFKDLNDCFPEKPEPKSNSMYWSSSDSQRRHLEVHSVGAYNMSFARNLSDLDRIDPKVFKVSPEVSVILSAEYKQDFGFVICAFDSSKDIKPHPVGYIHDSFKDGQLFVPTKHEHGSGGKDDLAHFDHSIFSLNTDYASAGDSPQELATKYFQEIRKDPKRVLEGSIIKKFLPLVWTIRRLVIKKKAKNQDTILTEAPPEKETINQAMEKKIQRDAEMKDLEQIREEGRKAQREKEAQGQQQEETCIVG